MLMCIVTPCQGLTRFGSINMRHNAGFTLIELMVALSVMAIVAVLAAPSIGQTLANQQVKQAAFELAQTLQTARSNAIIYRRAIIVRSAYTGTANRNWNGSGGLYKTDVSTAQQNLVSNASWYVLETGTGVSTTASTNNRVSATSKVNTSVDVNLPNIVAFRFLPDASVEVQAVQDGAYSANTITRTFSVCPTNASAKASAGRQVIVNRFGNVTVSEKSTGVC